MFLATKKGIFIIVIQILLVIIAEVNSSPVPDDDDSGIFARAWESVKNVYNGVQEKLSGLFSSTKNEIIKEPVCFRISYYFDKAFDVFFTDKTSQKNVKFYFSSQKKPNYATVTTFNDTFSLENTDFDPYRDTVVISHGFQSSGKVDWIAEMKDAFLKWDDVNVIVVDWEEGSNTWDYIGAAVSTQIVGDEVAKLFDYIYDDIIKKNLDLDLLGKMHFVGHSLGAHIVARAANKIKKDQVDKNREKAWIPSRITGLDPAQPCFITAKEHQKLDEDDAEFVDVIHTNARSLILLGLGLPERVGYLDFYPNGGQMQPGCPIYEETIWPYVLTPRKMINATVCSHGRAYLYFTDSILESLNGNCTFISHPWDQKYDPTKVDELMSKSCTDNDCPPMGIKSINAYPGKKGVYFTPTSQQTPYCVVDENDKSTIAEQLQHDDALAKAVDNLGK